MGTNQSFFFLSKADPSLLPYAGTQWLEEERRVEWQPDGINNKTVIERYVIMAFSSCGKWYQGDIPVKKKKKREEKEPLLIKKTQLKGTTKS